MDLTLNLPIIWPIVALSFWGIALMFIDFAVPKNQKEKVGWVALIGMVVTLAIVVGNWNATAQGGFETAAGHDLIVWDKYSSYLNILYLVTGILSVLLSIGYLRRQGINRSEYYFLMIFSIVGMMLMGMSNDLIMLFLAVELLSIPLYILSGFNNNSAKSEESALKYFLLGAFSSGFLVFGIALLYGGVGSTGFPQIAAGIADSGTLGLAGMAMILVGLAFKVGAAPFHMWAPDVYEGAPSSVTAFMSVGAKIAGFAGLIRLFTGALGSMSDSWAMPIAVIAALTMIIGSIAAVTQSKVKRMLAFSSIANAGYILMAVASSVNSDKGITAALFYMLIYLFTTLGLFALFISLEKENSVDSLELNDLKGLGKRNPAFALLLSLFMLSLTGIPLTGGFMGKWYVFESAVNADLIWLAIIGALASVVAAFYYLRVIVFAFMHDGETEVTWFPATLKIVAGISAVVVILAGVVPTPWYDFVREALPSVALLTGG